MKKTKRSHKIIAVFLALNFLTTLVPLNQIFANNNGPKAPEAAAFEPVDATDMVNLLTGDLSYVIPLLNVPGPEGGYPISLAYHAGIAMDQEASWVGLGWNLNPGAISRNVNGYPDDWNNGTVIEYFHDEGEETVSSIGIGFRPVGIPLRVGLDLSWGSNRAFGGSVSIGVSDPSGLASVNLNMGGNGASIGIGYGYKGFKFSAQVGNKGYNLGVKTGVGPASYGINFGGNYEGESSFSGSYEFSIVKGVSIGVGISSKGTSLSINALGVGFDQQFYQTISMNDYDIQRSSSGIGGIPIPTPIGIFDVSFSKQKIRYELNKEALEQVYGPLYMGEIHTVTQRQEARVLFPPFSIGEWFTIEDEADLPTLPSGSNYETRWVDNENTMMDTYVVDATRNYYGSTNLRENIPVFPTYDNYSVNAQGLTGNMKPRMLENGALLGLEKDLEDDLGYTLTYETPNAGHFAQNFTEFDRNVHFYFDNDYASSLALDPINFVNDPSANDIFDYVDPANVNQIVPRKKAGRFIESYTNAEIASGAAGGNGFLKANTSLDYGDANRFEQDGIGGFKITAMDGKIYHYSLAVYNHEVVNRRYGMSEPNKPESENYLEKRQLKKYATHWLLTAVTGPDFIDMNNNELVDDSDYGYWVSFDYGKWSEAYAWKTPYGKDYEEYNTYLAGGNEYMRYYTWGRKDIYYLDAIKTRTHAAYFLKNSREDNIGSNITHNAIRPDEVTYQVNVPSQELLRLDKVVLVQNDQVANPSKTNNTNIISNPNQVVTLNWQEKTVAARRNWQNKVLDMGDFTTSELDNLYANALKVIDLGEHQDYSLAEGSPNSIAVNQGRLTLNGITYKGKGNVQVVPGYKFDYANIEGFDNEKEGDWGYNKTNPHNWSLNEITVPYGGKITMEYEPDIFHTTSVVNNGNVFDYSTITRNVITNKLDVYFDIEDKIGIAPGNKVSLSYFYECYEPEPVGGGTGGTGEGEIEEPLYKWNYAGLATIQSVNTETGIARALSDGVAWCNGPTINCESQDTSCDGNSNEWATIYSPDGTYYERIGGGIRVKSITTSDELQSYTTKYSYPKEVSYTIGGVTTTETVSSGVVSYVPHQKDLSKIIPYASELPPPIVMYEYVVMESFGADDQNVSGETKYHFQVLHPDNFISIMNATDSELFGGPIINTDENVVVDVKSHVIHDYLAAVGQVLSIENRNSEGQLMGRTTNNYKAVEDITQGIVQESFQNYKIIDYDIYTDAFGNEIDKRSDWIINSSTRISYPSIIESSTITQGGFSTTTYFDVYDFNTGNLLETRSYASDGTTLKVQTVPAYTKYPEMGSKVDDFANRNMMSQKAVEYSLIDDGGTWKPISVGITTWNKDWTYTNYKGQTSTPTTESEKIWRKHKTYVWDGALNSNGTLLDYTLATDDGFNWNPNATTQVAPWKQIAEITKYDHYSLPLETKDINDNYVCTKTTDDESKVILTSNAAYGEAFYTGVEYENMPGSVYLDQQIRGEAFRTNTKAHTGSYSVKLGPGDDFGVIIKANTYRAGTYKLSAWVHKDNYLNAKFKIGFSGALETFNGEKVFAGDWVLMHHYFDRSQSETTGTRAIMLTSSSGDIFVDDLRLHPFESTMTSYVYNQWDELEFILGSNNLATQYIYDAGGRLIEIHGESAKTASTVGGFNLVQDFQYNYKRPLNEDPGGTGGGGTEPDPLTASGLTLYVNDAPSCGGCDPGCGTCSDACELVCQKIESNVTGIGGGSGVYLYKWYLKIGVTGDYNLVSTSSSNLYQLTYNITTSTLCEEGANPWIRMKCIISDVDLPDLNPLTIESPQRSVNCTLGGNQ